LPERQKIPQVFLRPGVRLRSWLGSQKFGQEARGDRVIELGFVDINGIVHVGSNLRHFLAKLKSGEKEKGAFVINA
jgi:hypothetical protein